MSTRACSLNDLASTIMVLCRGRLAGGRIFWAYMCIKPSQARSFYEAQQRGAFDLEDYGTVIEWGEGENPPENVKERMRVQYAMREDFEAELIRAMEQHG